MYLNIEEVERLIQRNDKNYQMGQITLKEYLENIEYLGICHNFLKHERKVNKNETNNRSYRKTRHSK